MKMLTVGLLVCAMMALSTAEAPPEEIAESDQAAGDVIEKAKTALPEEIAESDQAAVESHLDKRWTKSCFGGWTLIYGRSFRYVPKLLTWAQAERNCLFMGGNLASVHSVHEYRLLQRLVITGARSSRTTWIGGSDAQQERFWLWSDGSQFRYSSWCPGEPNNHRRNQHCLQMNFSARKCWDDFQCHARLPSICVKRKK